MSKYFIFSCYINILKANILMISKILTSNKFIWSTDTTVTGTTTQGQSGPECNGNERVNLHSPEP